MHIDIIMQSEKQIGILHEGFNTNRNTYHFWKRIAKANKALRGHPLSTHTKFDVNLTNFRNIWATFQMDDTHSRLKSMNEIFETY